MIYNKILVRFGDLTLKGRNRKMFVSRVVNLVKEKLDGLKTTLEITHDRIYVAINGEDTNEIIKRLSYVSGISSYSLVVRVNTTSDMKEIKEAAVNLINEQIKGDVKFKVESKRSDKTFPLTSLEISKEISSYVLKQCQNLHVDVHNPEETLYIELRNKDTYLYLKDIKGMGGFPVGVAGKGLLMLSGGIDSPVAGYLAMKQGVEIECVHFESTPLTSIESAQKVIDLVKKMAKYAPKNRIKVHFVPFKELHMALLDNVPESYNITIMRRMMYRITSKLCDKFNALCIVNGESVGQVASQTLGSMNTINSVTNVPVIRPVVTYDKNEIIKISRMIDTYDISIKPFEDCCTVYVPKSPATAPTIEKSVLFEKSFDYESLVDLAVENVKTVTIDVNSDLDLSFLGLEVRNVL
jgi:thiamine biosynthesis protein ThiI